jgi:hypothetical protein
VFDDGVSPIDASINPPAKKANFQFKTVKLNVKDITIGTVFGDQDYTLDTSYQFQFLDKILILNADDLKDNTFACYFDENKKPVKMIIDYNPFTKVLTLKTTTANPDISLLKVSLFRFGKAGDEKTCDASPSA